MCDQETFVSREGTEDEHGEFDGGFAIMAMCNGAMAVDCGWRHTLAYMTGFGVDWFITNGDMGLLHAAHMANVPVTEMNGSQYIL